MLYLSVEKTISFPNNKVLTFEKYMYIKWHNSDGMQRDNSLIDEALIDEP